MPIDDLPFCPQTLIPLGFTHIASVPRSRQTAWRTRSYRTLRVCHDSVHGDADPPSALFAAPCRTSHRPQCDRQRPRHGPAPARLTRAGIGFDGLIFPSNRSAETHITSAQPGRAGIIAKSLPTNPPTTSIAENAASMAQSDNYLVGPNKSARINPAARNRHSEELDAAGWGRPIPTRLHAPSRSSHRASR